MYVFAGGWPLFFEGIGLSCAFKKTNSTKTNKITLWWSNLKKLQLAGKAFAAEQKIRELKTRISKLKAHKNNLSSAGNMNNV